MLRRVSGVEHHNAEKDDHVRKAIERRIEKAAELRYVACQTGDVSVQHVEEIRYDQNDPREEKFSDTKKHAAADVDRYTDRREDVRMNPCRGECSDHRVDDPHCSPAYACS